ncbi:MAG: hypothetical protein KF861_23465, partial [Planctomycetaceae bacterium]|nr:hypothetical protein [Planctomycetaceae bacterium]
MPVKIRCRGCEKILNAPDAARGKIIKCPQCGAKLKVPLGKSTETPQTGAQTSAPAQKAAVKKRRTVKAAAPPPSSTELFANLDFSQVEDTKSRICPYCATDLEEETDVCPGCGMNVVTGQMDKKEAIRRSRKGPDPVKFYKEAWTDSWAFLRRRLDLAFRTGWYLAVFIVLSWACVAMVGFCTNGPPKTFWAACAFVAMMGLPGWFFYLSMRIVEFTMSRQEKMDRVHFDFFQCVTLGLRTIFWPGVMLIPFAPVIGIVALTAIRSRNLMPLYVLVGVLAGIPLLVLPLAIVHMTQKYTYKAWILWELSKVFVKNAAPALYWVFMALLTFIIPIGGAAVALQLFGGGVNPFMNKHYLAATGKLVTMMLGQDDGWQFVAVAGVLRFLLAFVVATPVLMLAGFPLVFLMRANGLLGYYRQQSLGLVPQMAANTPCGFWVRMLAFLVDVLLIPLSSFIVVKERRAMLVAQLLNAVLGL